MELIGEYFRAIIFHKFRQECIDKSKSMYGNAAPSYSTVKNWFSYFNRGRHSLKEKIREGPPKMAELIIQNRHVP